MNDKTLVVNEKDEVIGEEDKFKCHLGDGILHRAYLVIIFNGNKVLLTKRSDKKLLWPGFWDGSIASHVRNGESYEDSARRRMKEEIGIDVDPLYLFKFEYKSKYGNIGTEHEICAVLKVRYNGQLDINPNEISEYKFVKINELREDVKLNPEFYCPWFIIALNKI